MKSWSGIATWGLIGLIVINVGATASHFVLQARVRQAKPAPSLAQENRFSVTSGIDLLGAKWEARDAPCRVIRITDDHCGYCKKDKPSYEKLMDAARRASCEIIEIAPTANAMAHYPRPGVVQLKFVDADIGAVLWPFATPQTIILDRNWSVKMTRRGMFDEKSLTGGIALLGTFSAPLAAR